MMKIVLPTASFFVLFIFLAFSVNAQGSFVTQNYAVNASSSPVSPYFIGVPSFPPDPSTTCSIFFNSKTSMSSGGTFDVTVQYFSPNINIVSQGTQTGQTSFVFRDFSTDSSSTLSSTGTYEALVKFVHSAASRDGTLNTELVCSTTTSTTEIIINRSDTDSHGNYPWATRHEAEATGGSSAPTTNTSADFAEGFLVPGSRWVGETSVFQDSFGCSTGVSCAGTFLYPFNSSPSGEVHIFVNASNSTFLCEGAFTPSTKVFNIEVVKASDGSIINLFTVTSTCPGATEFTSLIDTDLLLDQNSLYFLSIYGSNTHTAFASNFMTVRTPQTVNISIDTRTPNFVCPEFGECINNSQSRICVDDSGNNFVDDIQIQSCFSTQPFEEIVLGFDTDINPTTIQTVLECKKDPNTCFSSPQNIDLLIPTDWTIQFESVNSSGVIVETEVMAFLTSEEAFVGTHSLEMNYRPPKVDVVFPDGGGASPAVCDNASVGFPSFTQTTDLNATIISNNFTFPSVFPSLRWAVKRASQPREQFDVRGAFCGLPFPFGLGDPNAHTCYAGETGDTGCDRVPGGRYIIRLQELDATGSNVTKTVFEFPSQATSGDWEVNRVDINSSVINQSRPHRILIEVSLLTDQFTLLPTRLFFDDFRIQSLSQPLIANCTTFCDGRDLVQAVEQGDSCFITTVINETSCAEIDDALIQAAVEAEQAEAFEAITFIQNVFDDAGLNQTVLDENNAGFVTFFFSPLFIALAIFVLIGGVLEYKVAAGSQSSGAKGLIFGVVLILGTVLLTSLGIMPIGFAILFVIISGALVMNVILKSVFSSG